MPPLTRAVILLHHNSVGPSAEDQVIFRNAYKNFVENRAKAPLEIEVLNAGIGR
jgi:hypothetical protein